MKLSISMVLLVCGLTLGACGGESALGEECGESGVDGECEDGAVCGKHDDAGGLVCLAICTDQVDCAPTEDCNGVEGTNIKGCRLK